MFGSNRDYDRLSARNVELARMVKEKSEEVQKLQELRDQDLHNNTILILSQICFSRICMLSSYSKRIGRLRYT